MDPRWWFLAICEYARLRLDLKADDYATYLGGRDLDNHSDTALATQNAEITGG